MTRDIKVIKPLCVTPVLPSKPLTFWQKFTHRQEWEHMEDCVIDFCGTLHTIKKGFRFDFASCPRIAMPFISDQTLRGYGPAFHDWWYKCGYPKTTADGMFRDVLKEIDKARAFDHLVMWLAVAAFGKSAYEAHRRRERRQKQV